MATSDIRVKGYFSDDLFEGKPSTRSAPRSNYDEIAYGQDRPDDPKALQALEPRKDKEVYQFKLKPFKSEAHNPLNLAIEQFELSKDSTTTTCLVKSASDSSYSVLIKIKHWISDRIQLEIDGRIVTVGQSKSPSKFAGQPHKDHYQGTPNNHADLSDELHFEEFVEGFAHSFMLPDFTEFEAIELFVKNTVLVMMIGNSAQINKY